MSSLVYRFQSKLAGHVKPKAYRFVVRWFLSCDGQGHFSILNNYCTSQNDHTVMQYNDIIVFCRLPFVIYCFCHLDNQSEIDWQYRHTHLPPGPPWTWSGQRTCQ